MIVCCKRIRYSLPKFHSVTPATTNLQKIAFSYVCCARIAFGVLRLASLMATYNEKGVDNKSSAPSANGQCWQKFLEVRYPDPGTVKTMILPRCFVHQQTPDFFGKLSVMPGIPTWIVDLCSSRSALSVCLWISGTGRLLRTSTTSGRFVASALRLWRTNTSSLLMGD